MNITNTKGIIISHTCERINSQRRAQSSNRYFNAFIKDAIRELQLKHVIACYFLEQVETLSKIFKDLIVSYDTNIYILRRI